MGLNVFHASSLVQSYNIQLCLRVTTWSSVCSQACSELYFHWLSHRFYNAAVTLRSISFNLTAWQIKRLLGNWPLWHLSLPADHVHNYPQHVSVNHHLLLCQPPQLQLLFPPCFSSFARSSPLPPFLIPCGYFGCKHSQRETGKQNKRCRENTERSQTERRKAGGGVGNKGVCDAGCLEMLRNPSENMPKEGIVFMPK